MDQLNLTNRQPINQNLQEVVITYANLEPNEKPKFTEREKNPLDFLTRLQRYLGKLKARRGRSTVETNLDEVIEACVDDSALKWWRFVKNDITNNHQFENAFIDKYWDIQPGIKR